MQPFILEEQLEVICDKDGREYEEVIELEKEEFFQVMLKIHEANSSRKWRSMIKNAKMEKSLIYVSIPTCNMLRILSSG